jgi:hypothetical protein
MAKKSARNFTRALVAGMRCRTQSVGVKRLIERERELAMVEEACQRAARLDRAVLRARGSELEAGLALGIVRQLFERRLAQADESERDALLAGPAGVVRPLLLGREIHKAKGTVKVGTCSKTQFTATLAHGGQG